MERPQKYNKTLKDMNILTLFLDEKVRPVIKA